LVPKNPVRASVSSSPLSFASLTYICPPLLPFYFLHHTRFVNVPILYRICFDMRTRQTSRGHDYRGSEAGREECELDEVRAHAMADMSSVREVTNRSSSVGMSRRSDDDARGRA
jgi:hypothetical protein